MRRLRRLSTAGSSGWEHLAAIRLESFRRPYPAFDGFVETLACELIATIAQRRNGEALVLKHRRHIELIDLNRFRSPREAAHAEQARLRQCVVVSPCDPVTDQRKVPWRRIDKESEVVDRVRDDQPRSQDLDFACGDRFDLE